MKKLIDRRKEVSEVSTSFQEISPVQKKVFPSHKLQEYACEW